MIYFEEIGEDLAVVFYSNYGGVEKESVVAFVEQFSKKQKNEFRIRDQFWGIFEEESGG